MTSKAAMITCADAGPGRAVAVGLSDSGSRLALARRSATRLEGVGLAAAPRIEAIDSKPGIARAVLAHCTIALCCPPVFQPQQRS